MIESDVNVLLQEENNLFWVNALKHSETLFQCSVEISQTWAFLSESFHCSISTEQCGSCSNVAIQTHRSYRAGLTYQRAVEKQRHSQQRADAEGQDEGPPPAPAQGAAVAGRANQRGEHEAEDGTEEPRQAVVLLGKTCAHTQRDTAVFSEEQGNKIRPSGSGVVHKGVQVEPWRSKTDSIPTYIFFFFGI